MILIHLMKLENLEKEIEESNHPPSYTLGTTTTNLRPFSNVEFFLPDC